MTTADGTASVATLAPAARSVVERHSIDYIPENGVTRSLDLSKDEQAISDSDAELQALGLAVQAAGPAGSAEAALAQRF